MRELFLAAVARVDPAACTKGALKRDGAQLWLQTASGAVALASPLRVLGAGKAAARMAAAVEELAAEAIVRGVVIAPPDERTSLRTISLLPGSHPVPDRRSLESTRALLELARQSHTGDTLFLLSGGASSLLVAPRPPLTLADKQAVNELLLRSGASVAEVNAVRKHLSLVKGGQLLREVGGRVTTLAISDVPGDDPSVIGSAPTYWDPTTYADARNILRRYRIAHRVPEPVHRLLEQGAAGRLPETVKPMDREAEWIHFITLASNRDAQQAVLDVAQARGWHAEALSGILTGETAAAARSFAQALLARCAAERSSPLILVAGGETTVTVRGSGKGGRNQEFALALLSWISGVPVCVLSAGTDGIDGPTDAAGAFADGDSLRRAAHFGLDPHLYLERNDSYSFFAKLDDLLVTGPTGTNVMDLKIAIIHPPAS